MTEVVRHAIPVPEGCPPVEYVRNNHPRVDHGRSFYGWNVRVGNRVVAKLDCESHAAHLAIGIGIGMRVASA